MLISLASKFKFKAWVQKSGQKESKGPLQLFLLSLDSPYCPSLALLSLTRNLLDILASLSRSGRRPPGGGGDVRVGERVEGGPQHLAGREECASVGHHLHCHTAGKPEENRTCPIPIASRSGLCGTHLHSALSSPPCVLPKPTENKGK